MPAEPAGWTVAVPGDLRMVMRLLRERLRGASRA
jgi:hypothetical protein